MLRLSHRHPITGNDQDMFGTLKLLSRIFSSDTHSTSPFASSMPPEEVTRHIFGPESSGDHRNETSIHCTAHNVRKNSPAASHQSTRNNKQII